MSDIQVALSTTRYLIWADRNIEALKRADIPTCCAVMGLGMFGSGIESMEFNFSEICKDMAKTVFIDVAKKWVFIGENPAYNETGLIDYTEEKDTEITTNFFKRWEETNSLSMEFLVINPVNNENLFCLKGIWIRNSWAHLDVITEPKIIITKGV